ncbi:NADH:flavin oxidoreductase [Clostridium felsineum]|uniref:NADH:flavin oxidoreductase n=1 Tax=Clostridium felsineum TaxID=36839 RepID=UPI00098C6297|nr:NADH:flavin oxidoreductase [Clostridium felsineum]URZ15651.1 Metal reductase [Clostridium felsineum DSM 794]
MKTIFEKANVGAITLKNRIIRSATQGGAADQDGHITEKLISIYEKIAAGGAGAAITGMMGVDENSRVFPHMAKVYDDDFVSGLSKLVNKVHTQDCKIIVQLAHCGAKANPDNGNKPLAPSDIMLSEDKSAKSMTKEEIQSVIHSFALAAERCKEAGADGVQIHSAHGYLLSQFLSPFFNKRNDEYGGDISNRAKIVFEVYAAIREKVGNDYPIWVKVNGEDYVSGGLSLEECLWVCCELDKLGINGIEISGGIGISPESAATRKMSSSDKEGVFAQNAMQVAEKVNASVISVGWYRTPDMIEEWLNKGKIQAISLCRPLICEPELPNIWGSGNRRKSKCISCNKCYDFKSGFGCKVFK